MKKILLVILLVISGISAVSYRYFSEKLNVDMILLRKQDTFKIANQSLEFKLNRLRNVNYNLVLKYVTINESDVVAMNKAMYSSGNYNVVVQLLDARKYVDTIGTINDGSKLSSGSSPGYVEWYLAKFAGADVQDKTVKINFQTNDSLFDRLPKEINLVQDYDYASLPWWQLLQRVSLISLGFSVIIAAIIGFLILKRPRSIKK